MSEVSCASIAGNEGRTKVFVVSDHWVVREGLKTSIAAEADLELVGSTGSGTGVLGKVETSDPEVMIVDTDGERGSDLVRRLAVAAPTSKILALTGSRDADCQRAMVRSGARGLVLKEAPAEMLLDAIRRLNRGEMLLEPHLVASVYILKANVTKMAAHSRRIAALTHREREIVSLIAEGLRNHQIASHIGIAEKSVRNQLSSIYDKLGVNDRLELAVYAYQYGLAHPRA
jgi:DNA-binding NarL/FixJ family response regulator